ncbi:uncharacterized protein LOC115999708 [Ipomoea triloba]|uniref:uncharacterized protein LOC115999708 n=1 Tax=Ipomoea triloba TaxID=35885 RepID=UPI00125E7094|nr:uncharacterized protein LOC115999708 [Ipomoea triloba]
MIVMRRNRVLRLRWSAPSVYRFTLNVDGSVKTGLNRAGFDGVMRNNTRKWGWRYYVQNDIWGPSLVETRAIVECLSWVWQKGIRDLEVQSDAKNIVQWIQKNSLGCGPIRQCIEKAKWWINRDWRISLLVVYSEQNKVADYLASFGALQVDERKFVDDRPIVSQAYLDDLAHIKRARRVVETT